MDGEERNVLLEFSSKLGELSAGVQGLMKAIDKIDAKIDRRDELCRQLRSECVAVKEIPLIKQVIEKLTKRVEKLELNKTIQQLTMRQLLKIIGAAATVATGVSAVLKALGIL